MEVKIGNRIVDETREYESSVVHTRRTRGRTRVLASVDWTRHASRCS